MVYSAEIPGTLVLWSIIFSNPEGTALRRRWRVGRGKPGYMGVLWQRTGSLKSMQDAGVWAHWNNFFDMHLSYLGPISCVFTSRVSPELTVGSGCSLMAAGSQIFFPSWIPSGLTSSPSVVAAIAGDCDILFYWCSRKYSIS